MADDGVAFDWDEHNISHLKRHRVAPDEFEQVILNEPIDLEYQTISGEARYQSLGQTNRGRVRVIVWTVVAGKIRAVTAYAASRALKNFFLKAGS